MNASKSALVTAATACALSGCPIDDQCDPVVPPDDVVFTINEAGDEALLGGQVSIDGDLLTIEYERDGVEYTVFYRIGEQT